MNPRHADFQSAALPTELPDQPALKPRKWALHMITQVKRASPKSLGKICVKNRYYNRTYLKELICIRKTQEIRVESTFLRDLDLFLSVLDAQ